MTLPLSVFLQLPIDVRELAKDCKRSIKAAVQCRERKEKERRRAEKGQGKEGEKKGTE